MSGTEFGCALLLLGIPALLLGLIGLSLTLGGEVPAEQLGEVARLRQLSGVALLAGLFFVSLWAWLTHRA